MDYEIIDDVMEELKETVENNKMSDNTANNFFDTSDWEDDFSHNDIGEMQEIFMKQARKYLSTICKGKYIMYCDWCVHICSIDFFNKKLKGYLHRYEIC